MSATIPVIVPGPLLSYTQRREVAGSGATLGEVLTDLDRQYRGIRFRIIDEQEQIRAHVRVFVNGDQVFDLNRRLAAEDRIQIIQALSGG